MKKMLFLTLAVLLLPLSVFAGEIVFGWNKVNEAGGIQDMKFMPDESQFILTTVGKELQIRNTTDGELVKKYPDIDGLFEFTPDSSNLVIISGNKIQLRKLDDMSLINEYIIPPETDTAGLNLEYSSIFFVRMALDPLKPYAYIIRERRGQSLGGKYFVISKIIVFNYETMEEIKELYSSSIISERNDYIAISKDGKYLATIGAGKTYLKVWDLNTLELIRNFRLYDDNLQDDYWCEPKDIKFSEINTENIYFSGLFPRSVSEETLDGLSIFNIQENKIIDSTFAFRPKQISSFGQFAIFDDDERVMHSSSLYIRIVNFKSKMIEATYDKSYEFPFSKIIYSKTKNCFLGSHLQYYGMVRYDRNTDVSEIKKEPQIIYPNPTNGIINIKLDCSSENQFYEIYNSNSALLNPSKKIPIVLNNLSIDFTKYASGIYFLRIYCGKTFSTYKIVKKG